MGAQLHVVETAQHWDLESHLQRVSESLRAQGKRPSLIPVSGTTLHSCLGYVRCGIESAHQIAELGIALAGISAPFGTGGIFTAVLRSLRAQGITCPLIGSSVNQKPQQCRERCERWWVDLCQVLERDPRRSPEAFEIHDEFIGRE
jgi:1-aminocyclopropane-1-carboxylate deaminase/D-cysteine desulfhydrase-like pyridoxal-dependent ACC family enzyme